MSDIAIRAAGLSKQYRIGARERYRTLRDTVTETLKAPFRRRRKEADDGASTFWALQDVSFEVKHGEVIGVIGRNGAGKSTLLKILSRITEPTKGRAEVHGRVASLLEVGTGFHPELTGRDNIFLNGAILGMKKAEIRRKFDDIVAFAEVEKFIDTAVKHYSSGMYVRLAFAVAAHLEPEILVVDEVLAVGDYQFQQKCLGRMKNVASEGRTVLLVSHQMNQLRRLCDRCIWLERGGIRSVDAATKVIASYEASCAAGKSPGGNCRNEAQSKAEFVSWEVLDPSSESVSANVLDSQRPAVIRFALHLRKAVNRGHHGIALFDMNNSLIWASEANHISLKPGLHYFDHRFGSLPVRVGPYFWQVSFHDDSGQLDVWNAVPEMIVDGTKTSHSRDEWQGVLNLPDNFEIHTAE